jgi:hypothetical protein
MSENPRLSLGAILIMLILKEKHPEPVSRQELNDRLRDLIREHGSIKDAVEYMRRVVLLQ